MAKIKSAWFCTECGAESPKWEGKCPACGAWNTMVEERVTSGKSKSSTLSRATEGPQGAGDFLCGRGAHSSPVARA